MIHRRAAKNAEKVIIFRLSLRRPQTKTIMPSAIGSQTNPALQGLGLFLFAIPCPPLEDQRKGIRKNPPLRTWRLERVRRVGGETKFNTASYIRMSVLSLKGENTYAA